MNAIKQGLEVMCDWAGYDKEEVILDAPSSLTQGIPDSTILKQVIEGHAQGVIPLEVIHRYLVYSGLLDQTIGYEEYVEMIKANPINEGKSEGELSTTDEDGNIIVPKKEGEKQEVDFEGEGQTASKQDY
jgi:hypothetical protein